MYDISPLLRSKDWRPPLPTLYGSHNDASRNVIRRVFSTLLRDLSRELSRRVSSLYLESLLPLYLRHTSLLNATPTFFPPLFSLPFLFLAI